MADALALRGIAVTVVEHGSSVLKTVDASFGARVSDELRQHGIEVVTGVFVAGDVADPYYRQAITAAADGSRAAIDVRRWLERQHVQSHLLTQKASFSPTCC